jgi:hypothetical protein
VKRLSIAAAPVSGGGNVGNDAADAQSPRSRGIRAAMAVRLYLLTSPLRAGGIFSAWPVATAWRAAESWPRWR